MTDKRIPLAGVIGHPVAHSKSPHLHGHWLNATGLDGFYIPMDVAPENLETVLRSLPKAGFRGVNVTIPHKENALAIADEVTETAARIGAANTLTFSENGKIHGDNTDGYGFLANLQAGAPDWRAPDGPAVILGAGGASRAVILALLDAGSPRILLSNRTRERADALQQEFGARIEVVDWSEVGRHLGGVNLLVNTTSLGMSGEPALAVSLDELHSSTVVTDLVYVPLETDLLKKAKYKGCKVVDGLGMLLYQGIPGFERWFGVRPTVSEELREAVLA